MTDIPPQYQKHIGPLLESEGVTFRQLKGKVDGRHLRRVRMRAIYQLRRHAIDIGLRPRISSPFAIHGIARAFDISEANVRDAYEIVSAKLGGYDFRGRIATPYSEAA